MSDSLLLIDYVDKKLNPIGSKDVFEILQNIPNVKDLTVDPSDILKRPVYGHYCYRQSCFEVYLLSDNESLHIENTGDDGMLFALEFNKLYHLKFGRSLQLFNQAYEFHQQLDPDMNLEMLLKNIETNSHSGAPDESK